MRAVPLPPSSRARLSSRNASGSPHELHDRLLLDPEMTIYTIMIYLILLLNGLLDWMCSERHPRRQPLHSILNFALASLEQRHPFPLGQNIIYFEKVYCERKGKTIGMSWPSPQLWTDDPRRVLHSCIPGLLLVSHDISMIRSTSARPSKRHCKSCPPTRSSRSLAGTRAARTSHVRLAGISSSNIL